MPPTPDPTPTPAAPTSTIVVTLAPSPAPATQTVVVELPPAVIKQLAPPDDGLSQACATIIAALIAVAAALIAFAGVVHQVRSTAREQQKDRDDENRRLRRAERSQLLADAAAVAAGMQESFWSGFSQPDNKANRKEFAEQYREATLLFTRMKLAGLRNSAKSLDTYIDTALQKFGSDYYSELSKMHDLLIGTFIAELAEDPTEVVTDARERVEPQSTGGDEPQSTGGDGPQSTGGDEPPGATESSGEQTPTSPSG